MSLEPLWRVAGRDRVRSGLGLGGRAHAVAPRARFDGKRSRGRIEALVSLVEKDSIKAERRGREEDEEKEERNR